MMYIYICDYVYMYTNLKCIFHIHIPRMCTYMSLYMCMCICACAYQAGLQLSVRPPAGPGAAERGRPWLGPRDPGVGWTVRGSRRTVLCSTRVYIYTLYLSLSLHIYIYICIDAYTYGCGSKPRVVAGPPTPLLQAFVAAGCFERFVTDSSRLYLNMIPQGSALFWGGCSGGLCRRTPHLLQICVAKWPPKPVTNPIRCHIHMHVNT